MEKKVHFKLHKVKKHWVTIAVTGLTLGLSFAGLNYASAEEQPTPVNEATVEAIIKEGAIDIEAPATSEATAKPTENTPATASSETATVSEAPVAASEVASTETVSEKPSSEVTSTASSEAASSETAHSEVSATTSESVTAENVSPTTSDTDTPNSQVPTVAKNITGGQWYSDDQGNWHYKKDDKDLTGPNLIDGQHVYFDNDGKQVKGNFAQDGHYYDGELGHLTTESFVTNGDNHWYYVDKTGEKVTGLQEIGDKTYHFNDKGLQTKGNRVVIDGKGYYFHPENGELWNNKIALHHSTRYINGTSDDIYYYYDNDGNIYTGPKTIDGKEYYFQPAMVYYSKFKNPDGTESYYNEQGQKVYNGWGKIRYMYLRGYLWTPSVYADENGYVVHGFKRINGQLYYFDESGSLRDDVPGSPNPLFQVDGNWYYAQFSKYINGVRGSILTDSLTFIAVDGRYPTSIADENGKLTPVTAQNSYVTAGGKWYYVDKSSYPLKGEQVIDYVNVYFRDDYSQVKGDFAPNGHYYDKDTGALVTNRYIEKDGKWYYVNNKGDKLIGAQTVDFINVYFDKDGVQIKGDFAPNGHYYDKDTGALITNRYVEKDGKWYYVNDKGDKLVGQQTVDGVEVYFDKDGVQAKGIFANADHFYDKDTGAAVRDQIVEIDGKRYYVGPDARKVYSGTHIVHGEEVNLIVGDGHQAFGEFTYYADSGDYIGFDGKKVTKAGFVKTKDNHWYYLDGKGGKLVSVQVIDGELYYFGLPTRKYYYGMQSRGELIYAHYSDTIPNSSHIYYLDEATGAALKNQYHEWEGSWYYFGPNWYALTGEQTIDNVPVYFHSNGKQAKGELVTVDDKIHYYDANSGARLSNITITIKGQTYHFDDDGNGTLIS
ncbi:KxYKxGKxW signal peptide domain-containing protein [Streptococcus salivarius]|uniref:KxYKxGKxW signal peptide domain-containing protein n=1 Tax=Streptococcus salivarius TaxID=1304 RepID=UPI003219D80E